MHLSLDNAPVGNQISHYEPGKLKMNKRTYKENLVISGNKLLCPWTDKAVTELTLEDFTLLLNCKPSIILLGTGKTLIFPSQELIGSIQAQKIGFEVMDTAAACRTFNVLVSEGREVVAGLILKG